MTIKPEIKDKIFTAANALMAEGNQNPTNDQVRERIGKGSLAHISPVMREWRDSRKAEVAAALEMPAELKKAVETSLGQIWATASKLAQASLKTYRQEADDAIEAAAFERDEALLEIQRLEARLAEMEKALAEKDQVISDGIADLKAERALNVKLNSENAALSARIADRDTQNTSLKSELQEARTDNKTLQSELIAIAKEAKKNEP
jgi:chromosome segregation ATPase